MESRTILLVEDDREILNGLELILKKNGYQTIKAHNGVEALEILHDEASGTGECAEKARISLALVDVMMPQMDGLTLISNIRVKYDFPIIVLTAKSEEADVIIGLNIGADDYVTKPFAPSELLARINAQLRRYLKNISKDKTTDVIEDDTQITIDGLSLSGSRAEVFLDGSEVKLTPTEFKILQLLMKNAGRVFSAEEIYERVWNDTPVGTETVMVHIRRIREKIEVNPKKPRYLKVVWGIGYKVENGRKG